jgi:hypothetical protein
MQAVFQATSNPDILQIPLFLTQQYVRPSAFASPSNHIPVFERAAASLQCSITQSSNSVSHALRFLTETSNKLAAAYEQLSACTFAAHSLRRRSPCVLADDIMRCCRVSFAARPSTISADTDVPYPVVWGSDFEVRCQVESCRDDAAGCLSATLGPSSEMHKNARAPEDFNVNPAKRAPEDFNVNPAKRARNDAHNIPPLHRDVQDADSSAPEVHSQPALPLPLLALVPGYQDFEWLPGNGVI